MITITKAKKKLAVFGAPQLKKVGLVGRQQLFFQKSVAGLRILVILGCRLLFFKQQ